MHQDFRIGTVARVLAEAPSPGEILVNYSTPRPVLSTQARPVSVILITWAAVGTDDGIQSEFVQDAVRE